MLSRTSLWGGGLRATFASTPHRSSYSLISKMFIIMQRQKLGVERNPAQRVLWREQSDGDK
jgi:hypothetical protein